MLRAASISALSEPFAVNSRHDLAVAFATLRGLATVAPSSTAALCAGRVSSPARAVSFEIVGRTRRADERRFFRPNTVGNPGSGFSLRVLFWHEPGQEPNPAST